LEGKHWVQRVTCEGHQGRDCSSYIGDYARKEPNTWGKEKTRKRMPPANQTPSTPKARESKACKKSQEPAKQEI
jgi:hypothetical protein